MRGMVATFWANWRILRKDASFRRCVRMLLFVLGVSVGIFTALWYLGVGINAEIYGVSGSRHPINFHEYLFCVLGAIDACPEAPRMYALYAASVRLIGAIVIGGVLTSFLCTLLERYSDMTLRGLLNVNLKNHTIIVGYGKFTDDLIQRILEGEDFESWYPNRKLFSGNVPPGKRGKILLYTAQDVKVIREALGNLLPEKLASRVEYISGAMDNFDMGSVKSVDYGPDGLKKSFREVAKRICLTSAKRVFVLGDDADPAGGDLRNFGFAGRCKDYLSEYRRSLPFPIYLRMDRAPSFDMMKKVNYNVSAARVSLIPFGFSEGWARAVFGDVGARYQPLDYRKMGPDDYVHLIIAGMSGVGVALAIEAIRIAHFVTGKASRVTFLEQRRDMFDKFLAAFPGIRGIPDIVVDVHPVDASSSEARELIDQEARNPHCLLTVAVCYAEQDMALETALNLPASVYRTLETKNDDGHVPRVLVYQDHKFGNGRPPAGNSRYRFLQPFGWQEEGFQTWCLQRFPAMMRHWVYVNKQKWADYLDGRSFATVPHGEIRREAFRMFMELDSLSSWGSVYLLDFSGTVLRWLGLRCVRPDNGMTKAEFYAKVDEGMKLLSESLKGDVIEHLAELEHRRWMADRILMGFLPDPEGRCEGVDRNVFRRHPCIRPYDELEEHYRQNDRDSIRCIAFVLAFMGIYVDRRS